MNSLVSADYGSGSSDDCLSDDEYHINNPSNLYTNNGNNLPTSSSDNESDDSEKVRSSEMKKTVLPSASSILLDGSANTGQVFNNPYKKAENEQIASLEKHVKMVTNT